VKAKSRSLGKKKNLRSLGVKIAIVALAFAVVGSLYFNYVFYNQLVLDSKTIGTLNSHISDLQKTIGGLNAQLSQKDATIKIFSEKLGLAQNEISALTPQVKNYYLTAIGPDNRGVVIPLQVKIINGTGAISLDVNNVDVLEGVQESVRIAAAVAGSFTGTSLANRDIVISFINDKPYIVTVDGSSAGAAITTTIIAAVLNRTMDTKVLMTGTINADGSIGPVGEVAPKAAAAMSFGANVFLVPVGESVTVSGIQVKEIGSIDDAVNQVLE